MNRPGRPELLLTLAGLAPLAILAAPPVHQVSEGNLAVHHALHWALGVDGVLIGLMWAPRLARFKAFAAPGLLLGGGIQLIAHVPPLWLWAIAEPLSHGGLHVVILCGGMLIGAAYGLISSIGRAWFVLVAAAAMTPLTLAMVAGGISYPPYPVSESEAAGVVMLVAMQSMWLLALPGSPVLRAATARAREIFVVGVLLVIASWAAGAAI